MLHVLKDLLREFIKRPNYKWSELPEKVFGVRTREVSFVKACSSQVAVQMNDTHPTIAVSRPAFSCLDR